MNMQANGRAKADGRAGAGGQGGQPARPWRACPAAKSALVLRDVSLAVEPGPAWRCWARTAWARARCSRR